jgi:insulysin
MRSSSLRGVTLLSYALLSSSFSPALSGRANHPRLFASVGVPVDSPVLVQATEEAVILADDKDFVKPLPDKRQYRALKLNNGLQVLLVSAPESDVEAGSIHVQAGHFNDMRPGLAHFHEHMLFLGTEKYPSSEEYEKFLASNGGSSNAFTDMEDTNYYFSVTPSEEDGASEEQVSGALHGALDRLAQFFISPLFEEKMVDRELRAIDSEYRNSLTSDAWRNYQLLKGGSNPLHPFHKFGCGNYQTLTDGGSIVNSTHSNNMGTSPRDELLEFYKTYYQTYNMRLCVVSRASLDALQQSVQDTFGALPPSHEEIPRRGREIQKPLTLFSTEHAQYSTPMSIVQAFSPNELGIIRETVPLLESHSLKLSFAAPPLDDPLLKDSRPYRVISHILGHESPGSLHSLLNQEGWLTGLSSGIGIDTSDFSLFSLTLSLTPKGMREKDQVLDYIFQWIALLKTTQEDLLHAYHDELRKVSQVNFLYRENGDVTDFCSTAAELLFDYEPSQLLFGPSQAGDYDPSIGRAFMDRMTPENALITIVNSDIKDTSDWNAEPWYGAKYRNTKISPEQLERWANPQEIDPRLHLPGLNQYIPSDFSLRCDQDKEPVDIQEDNEELELEPPTLFLERPNLRMWFKMDRYWRVPKTYIRLSLLTPNVYRSPRTMTLNRIYQRVLQDDLNSFVYDASVAGCNYRVACIPTGYRISVKGYSEKLPFLLDTLTARMLSLIDELKSGDPSLQQKFLKAKEGLLRETKNYRLDTPYEVASYNARLLMDERVWYVRNYVAEMEGPTAEKNPLTMEECARVAEECLFGKSKVSDVYVL